MLVPQEPISWAIFPMGDIRQLEVDDMPRFHGLPFVDHVPYVTLYTIERWAAMGTIAPIGLGILLVYLYLVCGRHIPA